MQMQTSSGRIQEGLLFPVILACLLALFAWNLFVVSTSIFRLLTIHEASNSGGRFEESTFDHPNVENVRWKRTDQFLTEPPVKNECNYTDCVPVLGRAEFDHGVVGNLFEETFQSIRDIFFVNFMNHLEPRSKNRNGSSPSLIPIDAIIANDMEKNLLDDTQADHRVSEDPNSSAATSVGGMNNAGAARSKETISSNEATFQEKFYGMSPPKFMARRGGKFGEVAMAKSACSAASAEKYAEDGLDRENEDASWDNNGVRSSHELEARLEIAGGRGNSQQRLANLGTEIEKRSEVTVTRFLAEKLLASILRESSVFGTNSGELLGERTIDFEANTSNEDARVTEVERVHEETEKEEDAGLKAIDELEKFLSYSGKDEDSEMTREEGKRQDDREEKVGTDGEEGANCMGEERAVRSSKTATQSEVAGEKREVGPSPEATNSLENNRGTEATITLERPVATRHGKEEEDLNEIIRRMIITELKRHRKKERTLLKRARSDTDSVLPRKKCNAENRTGLFNVKGRTLFQDLLELEESLRKGKDNASDNESTEVGIVASMIKRKDSAKRDENSKENRKANARFMDRASISKTATACKADSDIQLERKVNASCLKDAETERTIGPANVPSVDRQILVDKSTQTEHVYVIRAVRSCPIRKKRLPMQFQMHRLALDPNAVSSKTVFASLDLSRFIFRKASDNLIYEKGKASHSPSYIPAPERRRWKYMTPSKVKE